MAKNINLQTDSIRWPIRQIILGLILFGSGIALGYTARDFVSQNAGSASSAELDASSKDDPAWGPTSAKVTMVEFGDFECQFCRQWYSTVYERLQSNYGNKIRFIFRDFPLSIHPNAQPAAVAANCAGEQGRYWEYFRLLYGDMRGLGSALYQTYAQEVGMNLSSFKSCLTSGRYAKEITLDMQDGERIGVTGVPAFFINGQLISGSQPYEIFQQAIDAELSK
jgi:protein-disulfide isomerase